jgi:hypothetical protein
MSLDIKEVIQLAREQFKALLPDLAIWPIEAVQGMGGVIREAEPSIPFCKKDADIIRLEEIEKEGENWAVTFSVPNPNYSPDALLEGIRSARNLARVAKVVVVDGSEGKLIALRERAA